MRRKMKVVESMYYGEYIGVSGRTRRQRNLEFIRDRNRIRIGVAKVKRYVESSMHLHTQRYVTPTDGNRVLNINHDCDDAVFITRLAEYVAKMLKAPSGSPVDQYRTRIMACTEKFHSWFNLAVQAARVNNR